MYDNVAFAFAARSESPIFDRLDLSTYEELRLVSRSPFDLATQFVFRDMFFDFDIGGLDKFITISRHPHLASCIRTVESRRDSVFKNFWSFDVWRCATLYEYPRSFSNMNIGIKAGMMSQDEWASTDSESLLRLYDQYEAERRQRARHAAALATALSMVLYSDGDCELDNGAEVRQAYQQLQICNTAVSNLRGPVNSRIPNRSKPIDHGAELASRAVPSARLCKRDSYRKRRNRGPLSIFGTEKFFVERWRSQIGRYLGIGTRSLQRARSGVSFPLAS